MIVFRNGSVWGTGSTALAVSGGRIVALGEQALDLCATEVVDLAGGALLPAFGDAHAHPLFAGLESRGPRVTEQSTVDGIVAEVRRWALANPGADWVVGASYDPSLAANGEFDARWLDAAVPDRPVVLRSRDYHAVWCNTEALRRAGVDSRTPDPRLGWITRRADGSPLGTLLEWHACDLVLDLVPRTPLADLVAALEHAGRRYAQVGVTWAQDAWVEPELVAPYLEAVRRGVLGFRADLAQRADPDRWRAQRAEFAEQRELVRRHGGGLVTARTVKFFADGVIEGGTGALLEPYVDAPHSHGMAVWPPEELARAVTAFDADGFQVHVHAIGDAAVRSALDAVAAARAANPAWDRRPVIAHVQLVHPADLPRFAELGVIANFEAQWACRDATMTELTIPRLGEQRAARQYPMGTLHRLGTRLSLGSDWPVSPPDPLLGIGTAVARDWLPAERLDLTAALTAQTAGAAWQAGAEHEWGRLAVGHSADLVALDRDPTAVEACDLGTIRVTGTWLAGRRLPDASTLD
ncbi:amidohydrolase [Kutzneria viridogrisea]|uniref:Amidohydrolase 3 domain-containing protein n=1 Tax=Kutzneria viridogrisea TaxID=47990 RepID=A0ABR6BN52_9PSEU|nr:hypothetical protein [Kutzneria viridogrisea]